MWKSQICAKSVSRPVIALLVMAICLGPGIAQEVADARRSIAERYEQMAGAFNRKDLGAYTALFLPDAVVFDTLGIEMSADEAASALEPILRGQRNCNHW